MPTKIHLPDILAAWPWHRAINPNYAECRIESQAWSSRFHVFSAEAQYAFDLCDPSLLASLAYPAVSRAGCRVVCDLLYIFGMFDDCTDAMGATAVQEWVDIIMDAFKSPQAPRPGSEPIIGEMIRSFWANAINTVGPTAQKRFIEEFEYYTKAVVEQAQDRDRFVFRNLENYMDVRRNNLGAKPAFALLEMDFEMPQHVYDNSALVTLRKCSVDMICLANDLYSFNVEQAKGDDHNIVALMMLHENIHVQEAINRTSAMHDSLSEQFLATLDTLPSFDSPAIDDMVRRYADGLGNWIRANDCWSFETWRYFKNDGPRVQRERVLDLLPQEKELTRSI
ncbi:terpenoid synthase [Mycena crocata]|nr:terpenoid synthase [Mycena crocata]